MVENLITVVQFFIDSFILPLSSGDVVFLFLSLNSYFNTCTFLLIIVGFKVIYVVSP